MNTIKIDKYFKGMVANRGLSGIETENTIFSFLAASNRSYYGISCDINVSKDNQIIATYDDTLLRLGLLNLYIPSFTYDELRKFSLVDRKTSFLDSNLYIPKLRDFLAICKSYRKVAFIRFGGGIKNDNIPQIINEINAFYDLKNINFIIQNKKIISHLTKKINHEQIYFDSLSATEEDLEFCKNHGLNIYYENYDLNKGFIKDMHLFGLKVSLGVINDKDIAEKLIKNDVDYIFTDILE